MEVEGFDVVIFGRECDSVERVTTMDNHVAGRGGEGEGFQWVEPRISSFRSLGMHVFLGCSPDGFIDSVLSMENRGVFNGWNAWGLMEVFWGKSPC